MATTVTVQDIMKLAEENLPQETPKAATAAATSSKTDTSRTSLLDSLDAIDNKYKIGGTTSNNPESLNLSKLEYTAPSDDEISALAQSQLTQKQIDSINGINTNTEKQKTDLETLKTSQEKNIAEQIAAMEKAYEDRKREAENDALRRGLARSSIITNKIEEFDKGKLDGTLGLSQKLADSLTNIDFQISSLETAKSKALDDFNLSFAAELNKKINELKTDRQSKLDEVTKYNNTLVEKEQDYQFKKAEAEQKAILAQLSADASKLQTAALNEKLTAVKAYYDAMDPKAAYNDFMRDSSMQQHLKEYYNYMYSYLKSKAGL